MSNSTYFVQECPTCGRQLEIRVGYLGRKLTCQHCQGQFVASDPASPSLGCAEHADTLLRRADDLLKSSTRISDDARMPYPR